PTPLSTIAFASSLYARRGRQSVHFRVYLVAVRSPWQAKHEFSRLSCRGASAAPSKACIFAFILSRCVRRGKQSVHFRVYLVAVRSPWQAIRAFSRLSCRGALAVASKACIFAFILSQCARRGKQSVNFRVYLVMVRSSCGHSQVISPFYLLTCTHSEVSFSKMMQVFIIIKKDV